VKFAELADAGTVTDAGTESVLPLLEVRATTLPAADG
jgi:hypothetical protein